MAYKYCQHVRENGLYCCSGAVKGRAYCYFHLRTRARRLAMAKAQAKNQQWRLQISPLEDMHAVQSAVMQVLEAVNNEAVDPQRARLMLQGLQQAASNLRSPQAWTRSRFELSEFEESRVDSYPGLEAEFDLPKRIDLDAAPEAVFPPSRAEQTLDSTPTKKRPASVKKTPEPEELAEVG
jgi:hypothetical protein